ncbi:MAG: lysis system i-spanin subunit Rz [Telluria sp.]
MNPYTIIGALVLLIAVALGGAQTGRKLERSTWQAKELATAASANLALSDAIEKARRIQTFNEAKARKASAQHEQALSTLAGDYERRIAAIRRAGGLRIPAPACAATAGDKGAGAGRSDAASAGTVALPAITQQRLFDLAKSADELAEQLRGLQGWIRDAGFYGEPDRP